MTEADADQTDQDVPEDTSDLVFDAPDGSAATVITQGDPIRSYLELSTTIVDEAVWHFDAEGINVKAVDPANVGMVSAEMPKSAFSGYRGDGIQTGIPYKRLKSALSYARKGRGDDRGDPVRIDAYAEDGKDYANRLRVAIIRSDQRARRISEFYCIDPNSIRQEPDIPELDLPYHADPNVDALREAIDSLEHNHGWLAYDDDTLIFGSQPTRNPNVVDPEVDLGDLDLVDTFEFPGHAWADDDVDPDAEATNRGSIFSIDYLEDMALALKNSGVDSVSIDFGVEYPSRINFTHTGYGFEGQFMLAPRIQSN